MNVNKVYGWGSTFVVVAAIITGLFLSGSPGKQRQQRFDERRVNDLRSLTYQIENFRSENQRLPSEIDEMVDGRILESLPRDPETQMIYTYAVVSDNTYRLCADFKQSWQQGEVASFWDHEAGYHCYEIILPELQPPPPRGPTGTVVTPDGVVK